MKNNLMKTMALLLAFGLMTAAPLAYAESDKGGPEGPGYHKAKAEGFFKNLNLTPEQKAKIDAQREAQKEKNKAVRDQLKVKMQALHEEISKPATDRAKLDSLIAEVNILKGQLFVQHIEGVLGMKEVLTPEQFAKMQEHFKEYGKGKHGGWMKHQEGKGQGQEAHS